MQWKESTLSQTAILLTCIILTTYVLSTDYVFKKKKKKLYLYNLWTAVLDRKGRGFLEHISSSLLPNCNSLVISQPHLERVLYQHYTYKTSGFGCQKSALKNIYTALTYQKKIRLI